MSENNTNNLLKKRAQFDQLKAQLKQQLNQMTYNGTQSQLQGRMKFMLNNGDHLDHTIVCLAQVGISAILDEDVDRLIERGQKDNTP